ncbi:MAG: histidine kinase [Bacteroidetes bacterium]|nr:histidine kinase [Bacteroidota bacterium]
MMKSKARLRRILISSWLLALIPAIIIALILPPLGAKYRLIVGEGDSYQSVYSYEDLNSDGITELISTGKGIPYYFVVIHNNDGKIYDQWNLKDEITSNLSTVFYGNYDNDDYKEIYIFTSRWDSLFLNINEFFDPAGLKVERIFITKIGITDGTPNTNISQVGLYDVNKDGFSEFYFSLLTGFALEPRHVYYFNIISKQLKSSQFTGAIFQYPSFTDADGDNKPEIFGLFHAAGNYNIPSPFTDWSTWMMVYDENLNFEFPPVEFPGLTNNLETYSYKHKGFRGYVVSHNTSSADSSVYEPRIMVFSLKGKKLKENLYSEFGFNTSIFLHVIEGEIDDRLFVFGNEMVELNNDLEIINSKKLPFATGYYASYMVNIDDDGSKEFLLYSDTEKKVFIVNSNLKIIAQSDLQASGAVFHFSHYRSADGVHKVHLANTDFGCLLELKRNNSYYFGYLIYPLVYLLIVLFIKFITGIAVRQVEQRENLKQRLLTVQLQGIKSQLDPHFTFNSLNSIASLIYLEERQAAYDYLNKFTSLLRGMLNDAEKIHRTLGEEIEFVTTYLELEKMRFGDKLEFNIDVDDTVTGEEKVPKLVLHTFAENAIKHGIIPNPDGGKLQITIKKESDYLKITIEDNGIGRVKAAGQSHSTGKGLKLTGEFYDILNQLNKRPITHSITDLYDDSGNSSGTRVEVSVPLS